MKSIHHLLLALGASCALVTSALAQVTVSDPWVRATVPVQKSSGAFMSLKAGRAARLVKVSTPVAAAVELHRSSMADGMMKMQEVDGIDLPAGASVNLASGGYHLMLVGLKRQLKEGETVPLTLVVRQGRKNSKVTVQAAVKPMNYAPPQAAGAQAGAHHE
jgi:copper(I)-binding protein